MIKRIIHFSIDNQFIIILMFVLVAGWGWWALNNTPVDAIPDVSDNQVIVLQSVFVVDLKAERYTSARTWGQIISGKFQDSLESGISSVYCSVDD